MIYVMIASKADIREPIDNKKRRDCYGKLCLLTKNLVYLACFAICDH